MKIDVPPPPGPDLPVDPQPTIPPPEEPERHDPMPEETPIEQPDRKFPEIDDPPEVPTSPPQSLAAKRTAMRKGRVGFLLSIVCLALVLPSVAHATNYRYTVRGDSTLTSVLNTYWAPVQDHAVTLGLGKEGEFTMLLALNTNQLFIDAHFTEILNADSTHAALPYTGMHLTAVAALPAPSSAGGGSAFHFDPSTGALDLSSALNWDSVMMLEGIDVPAIPLHYFSEHFLTAIPTSPKKVSLMLGALSGRDSSGGAPPNGLLYEMSLHGENIHFVPNPEPASISLVGVAAAHWIRRRRSRSRANARGVEL